MVTVLLEDVIGQKNLYTWHELESGPGICGLIKRVSPAELASVFRSFVIRTPCTYFSVFVFSPLNG